MLELVDDSTTPALCAERFIDGADRFGRGFVKHNNNSGFVDHDEHRSTPQAFSAYSFYASEGDVLVCDVQGVDDLYTDPQLHSVDESRGEGDLGRRGMALFFATVGRPASGMSSRGVAATARGAASTLMNAGRRRGDQGPLRAARHPAIRAVAGGAAPRGDAGGRGAPEAVVGALQRHPGQVHAI